MFRIADEKDFTSEEQEKIITPHLNVLREYLEEFLFPDYIAFYLASGYKMNAIWEDDYDILISSVLDTMNHEYESIKNIKKKVTKILKLKYNLIVINEKPLKFKE